MANAFDDQTDDPFAEYFEEEEPEYEEYKPGLNVDPVGCFLNAFTLVLIAATLLVGLIFTIIFSNPQSSLNPLPPTTMPVLFRTHTPSPTPKPILPPTWTPTIPAPEQPTEAPQPTGTPLPTSTPVPTANLESGTTFQLQEGSPRYESNLYHPEAGCNWMGVGGEILDISGQPVPGVLVEARGTLGGEDIYRLTLSGAALDYGESGYEISLTDSPVESINEVWIQVLDQANLPLSEKIYLQTYDSCDSNLIIVNFEQVSNQ